MGRLQVTQGAFRVHLGCILGAFGCINGSFRVRLG